MEVRQRKSSASAENKKEAQVSVNVTSIGCKIDQKEFEQLIR